MVGAVAIFAAVGCADDAPSATTTRPSASAPSGTGSVNATTPGTAAPSTAPAGTAAAGSGLGAGTTASAGTGATETLPVGSSPGTDPADSTVYRAVASVIQEAGKPPMIAFALLESFPPQGGDIVLDNFSWADVEGEQTSGGTTWLDGVEFVGRRTATGFTLTQKPAPGDAPLSPLTYDKLTEGCTEATTDPMIATLERLDARSLGVLGVGPHTFDGHCGVVITAMFDTRGLRDAVAGLLGAAGDVSYDFQFRPVD